jgi:uncharacterized low-complexity protein
VKKLFLSVSSAVVAVGLVCSVALAQTSIGQRGYEGQPGNQGGSTQAGQKGYEGQPGNQGGSTQAGQTGYEGQPGNQSNGR